MLVGTLNVTYIRDTYLRGVTLGDAWHGPSADAAITSTVQALIEEAQGKLGIQFARQRVLTYPDPGLVLGVDYEIEGEPLTYHRTRGGMGHFVINLPFANIISIERIRVFYGNPLDQSATKALYLVPPEWILFTEKEGVLRIVPSLYGIYPQLHTPWGFQGAYDSLLYGYAYRDLIPGSWAVDYTIGYGQIPLDVARWIGLRVAIAVLAQAGASAGVGGGLGTKSLSMDGISQSVGYAQGKYGPYSGLVESYQEELKCLDIKQLKLRYHGIRVGVW
jgi:hypothetical protein